jgi:hypothetical protein
LNFARRLTSKLFLQLPYLSTEWWLRYIRFGRRMHFEVAQEVDATHRIALFRQHRLYSVCTKEAKIFAEFAPCDKNPRTIHES